MTGRRGHFHARYDRRLSVTHDLLELDRVRLALRYQWIFQPQSATLFFLFLYIGNRDIIYAPSRPLCS